ncbi:MAG: DNA-processing protein DprA [Chloroflexi bacterium]|nr:DNA-processing protein DprA [Chloroflexota bacterium]
MAMAALEQRFGAMSEAWKAGDEALKSAGLDKKTVRSVTTSRPALDPDSELDLLDKAGAQAFTWHDDGYPRRLKEIHARPAVLYVKGQLLPEDERSVAVVGTRRATAYGKQAAQSLSEGLARSGITVVSGLARGIDAVAHRAALDSGARTIAVMASGLDIIYPAEHANLADRIARNGALVTEHPIGTRPIAEHFPRRNRIMSGMTLGTLVIEAGQGSGALITANLALEQNREVFAVPGSIYSPYSRGVNNLIKASAAKLVSDHTDILEELNLSSVGEHTEQIKMRAVFPVDENESKLLQHISYEPVHMDEIVRNSGIAIARASGTLAIMEIKGLVKQVGGMNYVKLREEAAEYRTNPIKRDR